MKVPTATYRIQFRNGMTFDRAAVLVPYLKRLGISHLYASPVFAATSGSTHGYDIVDAGEIDPAIGGREGFDRLVKALKAEGLGLLLDIVPNHMAASLENPWWRDVIENGEKSRYARHFDIDWSRRLTLPFLRDTFETVLNAGEISVRPDPKTGKPSLACCGTFYPLAPASYAGREGEVLRSAGSAAIARLHDLQPYRLMSWREAPRDLSYRRFFEIAGLVGVRVEDGSVFDDTHRLVLELVRTGAVDGLRIDHVDGLADPGRYLERLRHEAGPDCYIVVEKILGEGERLPPGWPVSGTTGYEFIATLSNMLVDGGNLDTLRETYSRCIGRPVDMEAGLRDAKLLMVDNNFAGEVAALLKLALQIGRAEDRESTLSEAVVQAALRELLVAFPVYRTYGTQAGLPQRDREILSKVLETVRNGPDTPDARALAFLERILTGDVEQAAAGRASIFRTRFQQLTGPLMAKSVEDTLFYRHHALLALNEVGAEPLARSLSLDRFHTDMRTRLEREPDALSGTSTHDTKRGEDTRARLYAISEAPELWAGAVARWRDMNRAAITALDDGPAPEPAVEWMLYQALAGAWPVDLHPGNAEGLKALEERFAAYVEKALREAKLRTSWGNVNEAYETAVIAYARNLLSPANRVFLTDFADTLHPFIRAGLVNGITQTIVKLAAPGVPDIYQGSEGLDLSLVDPDNRREPDFEMLRKQLSERGELRSAPEMEWRSGRLKQHVVAALLHLRQEAPTLFRKGEYVALQVEGPRAEHILAFARAESDDALIVIAPRLVFSALQMEPATHRPEGWAMTEVALSEKFANRRYRDICTGKPIDVTGRVAIGEVFADHPFALLLAE
ncbi:malto-oligosyltrehalose synthase [Rhizobium puerariae]|uniref:Malto-oligosyltrehalose synthase n=1 Tax=Rhizobium puerariae TaxID=1585791 RepID=A0ABV6AC23_9HYPH